MIINKIKVCAILLALLYSPVHLAAAQEGEAPFVYVPSTISGQAQDVLKKLTNPELRPALPGPDDIKAWKAIQDEREAFAVKRQGQILERLQPTVTALELGGVPVLDIKPRDWADNGKVLVYTHGGAYTLFSAKSTLVCSASMAAATGLRVISIDYTLAPHAKWQQITDQVLSVFKALRSLGYAMNDIAIWGDSAGGGLAAGAVLKMRDQGMGMPVAVVLWSPWADITDTGDSYETLKHAEPAYVYAKHLKPSADAYAAPEDQKNPYVSPVYGDYTKGFPPTLIQGGTKEIFLSNFVRLYQNIDTAGQTVKLDIYEGMIHVFQAALYGAPESDAALNKVNAFLKDYLHGL
ncbi:alpha/beta hydrolase [Desulfovibrio mangrovi]|uniref:alpha/beta hydrolase fold domain-containing protein n=1 Tax=Desulfovibrio mangrovi TaxID=2976983 RepID=UPI0022485728|nr:alpha/beta hydrolase [Desulfovibrio mangrovi]UZP65831.1 alpha/beta hydrolase [Desulfovibrio mangrovi]